MAPLERQALPRASRAVYDGKYAATTAAVGQLLHALVKSVFREIDLDGEEIRKSNFRLTARHKRLLSSHKNPVH